MIPKITTAATGHRVLAALFGVILASPVVYTQQSAVADIPGLPPPARTAAAAIDPEKIRAHVRFLSLDLLEGRGPGTRGDQLAAEYIATQFALEGLEPAGDTHTYFQKVPLYAVHTMEEKTKFSFVQANGGQPVDLEYPTEIVAKDQTGEPTADIDAPIVFAGYGIHAPEYEWDDYAGMDMHGKVALVIVNEPPSTDENFFKGKALTYYGRWTYKYEEAARRGAVGVLIIHRTDLASYGWDVVKNSQAIEKSYLQGDPSATLRAASWIQHDVAQKLLTLAGLDEVDAAIEKAGKRGFKAIELPVHLKAHVESRVRRYDSTNVIAKVAGSARSNALLYTAHYDHLGIIDAKGDNIYNGAADNATAAAFWWKWRGLLRMPRQSRPTMCTLLRSRQKSRVYWARNTWECIRRSLLRNLARSELRYGAAHRYAALSEPGRGRHRSLAHNREGGKGFRSGTAAGSHSWSWPLLPQRPLLPGARGNPRVLSGPGRIVRRTRRSVGAPRVMRITCAPLSSAVR